MSRLFSSALDDRHGSSGAPAVASRFRDASPTRKVTHVAFVAITSLWLTAAAIPSARAGVVFGNLGASGTGGGTGTNNILIRPNSSPSSNFVRDVAMGFKTSNDPIPWVRNSNLASISVIIGNNLSGTIPNFRLGIYADVNGAPGNLLWQSAATPVSAINRYTFTFATQEGQVVLNRNTSYWVAPIAGSPPVSPEYRWYRDAAQSNPVAYNGSGFSYLSTLQRTGSSAWQPNNFSGTNRSYSLSIAVIPVPESSTLTLAGIGLVVGGWAARRNRRRRGGAVTAHCDDHAVEVGPALA